MYDTVKFVYYYWSFFVLFILSLAILNSIRGLLASKDFCEKDLRICLFGLIFSNVQLLIGIVLYFISPLFSKFQSLGVIVLQNKESRLYLIEYPITNALAIILITIGWSLLKRQIDSSKKFLRLTIFYSLGLIMIINIINGIDFFK